MLVLVVVGQKAENVHSSGACVVPAHRGREPLEVTLGLCNWPPLEVRTHLEQHSPPLYSGRPERSGRRSLDLPFVGKRRLQGGHLPASYPSPDQPRSSYTPVLGGRKQKAPTNWIPSALAKESALDGLPGTRQGAIVVMLGQFSSSCASYS